MRLPNETFEQMQMRLSLETIRELEVQNEDLKKTLKYVEDEAARLNNAQSEFFNRALNAEEITDLWRERHATLAEENTVLQNDITQLEAQLESERRSNKERAAWISQLQDQVAALQQAPARITAANPGGRGAYAPRSAREAADRIDPYDTPSPTKAKRWYESLPVDDQKARSWCGAGEFCDDVTCRGHW